MDHCRSCGRPADILGAYHTAIDPETELEGCITCILAEAVPVPDVIRISTGPRWDTIPLGFKRAVTVYDCGSYITLLAWAKLQRQRVVPVQPALSPDEEAGLLHLMQLQRDAVPELPPMPEPSVYERVLDWIAGWLLPAAWRTA